MAHVYRPTSISMPPPEWQARRDALRGGFTRPLTAADLAADPQAVLLRGTVYDGLAAALVDAEAAAGFRAESDRQDTAAADADRAARAFWDAGAAYVSPPIPRDASVGPAAWTWPDPDLVPATSAEDTTRVDASAAYMINARGPYGAGGAHGGTGEEEDEDEAWMSTPASRSVRAALARGGSHAARAPLAVTTASAARTAQRAAQPRAIRVMRPYGSSRPHHGGADDASGDASVYGINRVADGYAPQAVPPYAPPYASLHALPHPPPALPSHAEALVYGVAYGGGAPRYDVPAPPYGVLGVPNAHGLYKAPGAPHTTAALLVRDAAAAGMPYPPPHHHHALAGPRTDALGFRFPAQSAFRYDVPKFFPARGLDARVYEAAAQVAPDHYADLADMVVTHGADPDLAIEPLESRWEMMRDIARDLPHTRDPYQTVRTGPSVMRPGTNATPPDWYTPPGGARRW